MPKRWRLTASRSIICSPDLTRLAQQRDQKKPSPRQRRPRRVGRSIGETKAVSEEGFIYGLPIVMNQIVTNVLQNLPTGM